MVAVCVAGASVLQWSVVAGRGYLEVARWGRAPVRLHWTLPLGALVFCQGRFAPGAILGFVLLVLVHEVGHAFVVRRHRLRVLAIDVHALGGVCTWSGEASPVARARIAWGGVNAQLVAFGIAVLALWTLGSPTTAFSADLASAFTKMNGWMIALNLLPVPPLDGAEAWKLPGLLRARARARAARAVKESASSARAAASRTLALLDDADRDVPPATAAAVDQKLRELAATPSADRASASRPDDDPSRRN
jgi:Zn-dependent protease